MKTELNVLITNDEFGNNEIGNWKFVNNEFDNILILRQSIIVLAHEHMFM